MASITKLYLRDATWSSSGQTRTDSATTATCGMAATLTTNYIAAPAVNYGLRAVLTHLE